MTSAMRISSRMPSCEPKILRALSSQRLPRTVLVAAVMPHRLPPRRVRRWPRSRRSSWPQPTFCWVASARLNSATRRLLRITRMRSLMPRTSGSSLEIMRMPRPCCASSLSRRWISALAPTSTPRVGSSTMSILGLLASHLPTTTFCWLPPESLFTTCSPLVAMMLSCSMSRSPDLRSCRLMTKPKRVKVSRMAIERFSRMLHLAHQALRAAILGDVGDAQLHGLAAAT